MKLYISKMHMNSLQVVVSELLKRVFRHIMANGQTVRWVTQRPVIAELIDGVERFDLAIDIGCGGGTYAMELLAPRANKVIAFDNDYYHAWLTYKRAQREGFSNISVLVASAEALPYKEKIADLLLCSEVLEHLKQDRLAVREFARVSKQHTGKLVISVPYPPEPFPNPDHIRDGYTELEIRYLLETAGFKVEKQKFCMFTLSRLVLKICSFFRIPLPLLFLCYIESYLSKVMSFPDPYDLVVCARMRGDHST